MFLPEKGSHNITSDTLKILKKETIPISHTPFQRTEKREYFLLIK